ncbi:hypothetical protein EUTSA_v10021825mg [Eutrema salsugineum]|uniref:Uncharacterized protein n=1 Tax=Eutrema salsugineum TaxID=72664 RepID=V4NMW6_EUTSA|nr:hypothetical protein EUTSA_v10021825mg [Eutrema salsugineum]
MTPVAGLFMYDMEIVKLRDGHNYKRSHIRQNIALGEDEIVVNYRWSYVEHPTKDVNLAITARRYFLEDGDKFLVHYLQGGDHINDPITWIPVNPVLAQ